MEFTTAQKTAVYYPRGDLILSAAAGSGKTASLTARIAGLVAHGEDMGLTPDEVPTLDRMLVVTFTRAAAGEMKARISKALSEFAASASDADAAVRGRVENALAYLPSADISTIHSFLLKVLTPYFPAMGLSPDVRFVEERAGLELRRMAMRKTCDDFFARADDSHTDDTHADEPRTGGRASFIELCDAFARSKDSERLDDSLLKIAEKLAETGRGSSREGIDAYADAMDAFAEDESADILHSPMGSAVADCLRDTAEHFTRVFGELEERFGDYREAWAACRKKKADIEKIKPYCADIEAVFSAVKELAALSADGSYAEFRCFFTEKSGDFFIRMTNVKYEPDIELYNSYKKARAEFKEELSKLRGAYFVFTPEEIRLSCRRSARILRCAGDVIGEYAENLAKRKRELSVVDYDDMSALALKLLIDENGNPTAAAHEIGRRYRYIFIDEFQDTDSVQDRIFGALSCEGAVRFMVGDIKQSIYRFRGAEPEVFRKYRSSWSRLEPGESAVRGADGKFTPASLFMSENFRSAEGVVKLCNRVFDKVMPFGDTGYMKGDSLIYAGRDRDADGNALTPPRSEVVLVNEDAVFSRGGADGELSEEDGENVCFADAEYIAERIAAMLGKPDFRGRIIRAEDIAIILRAPSRDGAVYRHALEKRGIASMLSEDRRLGSYPSVLLMLCLIGAADNPSRDEYLIGALHSPVFGFTAGEVAEMRNAAGKMPLYAGLLEVSRTDERAAKCVEKLNEWRIRSRGMRSDRFIEFLTDDTDFFSIEGIGDNAAGRDAVNRLISLAAVYERDVSGGFGGVSGFAEYAADAVESSDREKTASARAAGSVSIVSVHGSKGLQYPIVFVAHCDRQRNDRGEREDVLFDAEGGFGFRIPDESGLTMCGTFMRSARALGLRMREISEEMRNLYVAMTRAEDLLIVTANCAFHTTATKKDAPEQQIRDFLAACADISGDMDRHYIAGSRTWLDFILPPCADGMREIPYSVCPDSVCVGVGNADVPTGTPMSILYELCGGNLLRAVYGGGSVDASAETGECDSAPPDAISHGEGVSEASGEITDGELVPYMESFAYEYPYSYLVGVPSKLVVSRLSPSLLDPESETADVSCEINPTADVAGSGEGETAETGEESETSEADASPILKKPKFMDSTDSEGVAVDGAARGSAVHVFMQFADFGLLAKNGASAELERLCVSGFMSRESASLADISELELFRGSALFSKLVRSSFVKREFRFNVRLPASEFTSDAGLKRRFAENGDKITVQGVVDCVFRDPDTSKLVLVDYKTDRIDNPTHAAWLLRKRHSTQLIYYRRICAALFAEPISRSLLYSTVTGECYDV